MALDPVKIAACFDPYRPANYTREAALATLASHVAHAGFRGDLVPMIVAVPDGYTIDTAAGLVRTQLLARV